LANIGPTKESEATREAVSAELNEVLQNRYDNFKQVKICKYGSDPLKTYLPNSDIDITLVPAVSDSADKQVTLSFYAELDSITKMLQSISEQQLN